MPRRVARRHTQRAALRIAFGAWVVGVSESGGQPMDAARPRLRNNRFLSVHPIGVPEAEAYTDVLMQAPTERPEVRLVNLLHHARQAGDTGGKSALYAQAKTPSRRSYQHQHALPASDRVPFRVSPCMA